MDIQRLRNLTTMRLHTKMEHIYEDLEWLIGEPGIMTHMIPRVTKAVEPWLREHVTDSRFWDGQYDPEHTGEIDLPAPSQEDRNGMFKRFAVMPNPLAGKDALVVNVPNGGE